MNPKMPIQFVVLNAINELQGSSNKFISDSQVAAKLRLPLETVRGAMEILQKQSSVREANSHSGYACQLSPGQRITFQASSSYKLEPVTAEMAAAPITTNRVFIGHGNSKLWLELAPFVKDRLKLNYIEFNSEPTAGYATKERLETMLQESTFAFLIMTAEEERADGTIHTRENVIHEIGLFQGKLGFNRAIILFEKGCSEFSNIVGLTQIRFETGNIGSCFEEVRRVLEREEII
jgi:predicted nucleotide-binding protein